MAKTIPTKTPCSILETLKQAVSAADDGLSGTAEAFDWLRTLLASIEGLVEDPDVAAAERLEQIRQTARLGAHLATTWHGTAVRLAEKLEAQLAAVNAEADAEVLS